MNAKPDTILIVENSPEVCSLLREQVLSTSSYDVAAAADVPQALAQLKQQHFDLLLIDLELPGLSGKDLLVALKAQAYSGPLIVMGDKDSPRAVIEALRLGATDYVPKPIREAEVIAAVERGLDTVRLRRHRDLLAKQLEAQSAEVAILHNIGQTVAAQQDLDGIFASILDGARQLARADYALLILRDEKSGTLVLRAGNNLHESMVHQLGHTITDALAEQVIASHETVLLAGDTVPQPVSGPAVYAVAYVPLVVQTLAIGTLAAGNHTRQAAFEAHHATALRALADFAAIASVSARLFRLLNQRINAVEEATRMFRERDTERQHQLNQLLAQIYTPLQGIEAELGYLAQVNSSQAHLDTSRRAIALGKQVHQVMTQVSAILRNQQQPIDGSSG